MGFVSEWGGSGRGAERVWRAGGVAAGRECDGRCGGNWLALGFEVARNAWGCPRQAFADIARACRLEAGMDWGCGEVFS